MKTLKELKANKALKVERWAVHQRDWETIKAEGLAEIERVNKEYKTNVTGIEKENGIYFSDGRFLLRPKYPAKMVGVVEFRSADYIFKSDELTQGSYGAIPKANELTRNEAGEIVGWVVVTCTKENINYTIL